MHLDLQAIDLASGNVASIPRVKELRQPSQQFSIFHYGTPVNVTPVSLFLLYLVAAYLDKKETRVRTRVSSGRQSLYHY